MSSSLITPIAPGLPALGRTFTALRERIVGPEPTDQQYRESFAAQLSDLDGYCRWALAGSALVTWEGEDPKDGLRRRIDELIDEHEGEIYRGRSVRCHATTRHCWMLGSNKAYARPTVVISLRDKDILKRTMRVILRSETLKSKGFGLKCCPNCDLELLTVGSTARLIHRVDESAQGLPISLCGAEIEVKDPVRSATLGGVIVLDGTYYGVTVAHAFTESHQASKEKLGTNVMLYDSDWAELSSEDESVEHGGAGKHGSPTSLASNTPKKTSHPAMACAIRSNQSPTPHDLENLPVAVISSQNPLRDADDDNYDDVDWALIEISNPIYHGMNGMVLDDAKRSWLVSSSFRNYPPRGSILTATRKGTVRGLGTGSTSSIKLLGSSRNRDVWSIQTERGLDSGDSGAWVADANTGDVYGVLVAGSAIMQEGYVIPACDIIDDIRRSTKARELRVPTMNDVLCLASRYGNVDFVKSLIAAGVVVNERSGSIESSTALLEAAEHEQLEVMKVLLSAGAKFDKQGGQQYGQVALLVSNNTSAVEGQAHTHGMGVGSIKLNKTEDSRLTGKAHERSQKLISSALETWFHTPQRHELIAIGERTAQLLEVTKESLRTLEERIEGNWYDAKRIGSALPPTILSH